MSANQPERLSGGDGESMDTVPVDVVVHGGSKGSSTLTRSLSLGAGTELSRMEDDPALVEINKRSLSEKEILMNHFRLAMEDKQVAEDLIAQASFSEEDVWKRALLCASSLGYAPFIFSAFFREAPSWRRTLLLTARDRDGFTWLHRAVVAGQKDVVELLSRRHPEDLNVGNFFFEVLHARTRKEGWTSIHLAVAAGAGNVLNLLIRSYGLQAKPPESEWDFQDRYWLTPLHYAVLGDRLGEIAKLLKWPTYDRHVNAHDYYVRAPLHMAACHSESATKILVVKSKSVDINAVDGLLYTPLHWAVYVGNTEAVRYLISLTGGRTIRATEEDIEGKSVFQIAVENIMLDRKVSKDIEKLLLTCAEVKDEVERLYRDRQVYVDAANAILVGAALIASVTFGGWLQPPQGGDKETNHEVRVFWTSNSLSFFFAIATVMAGAGAVLPMESVYIGTAVRNIRRALALTSFLLMISVVLVLVAFGAAGFASLNAVYASPTPSSSAPGPPVAYLRGNMLITTCIGAVVCAAILLWFCHRLYKIRPNWARLLLQIREFPQAMMASSDQGRDYGEIQNLVEAATKRARADMQRNGSQSMDRKPAPLPVDLVYSLKKASERAAEVQREASKELNGARANIIERALDNRQYGRDQVAEQQFCAFEEAYEKATSGSVQEARFNMEVLNHLSPQGIHFWVRRPPKSCTRAHSLMKDRERWNNIHQKLKSKRNKLEEEGTNFWDGMLAFEDWGF